MSSPRVSVLALTLACALGCAVLTGSGPRRSAKEITWSDTLPAVRMRLGANGITSSTFPSYVERLRLTHARRVRDGDLDHLVFYWLQSRSFTALPAIEPALSAKALVDRLSASERAAFLKTSQVPASRVPADVRARQAALLRALDAPSGDARLAYFRDLVRATIPDRRQRSAALLREYARTMRFVYEKEFVAQRSETAAESVAELYRTRGLSTDTAVEAGYLVYVGLGVLQSLEPDRRVRRVLIVGPGLDIAPRTGLLEAGPPESYQPWTVMDALVGLGLSRLDDLLVAAADLNPRVIDHLQRSRANPPTLTLVSGIGDSQSLTLSDDYRAYFKQLGRAIGDPADVPAPTPEGAQSVRPSLAGHLRKTVRVQPDAARTLDPQPLDVVTERLENAEFDLIIATNILPYFDDDELMLALTNIAGMLATGGVLLHNETRPFMRDASAAAGLPFEQSRQAVIATVRGAPGPLVDSVWLHRKRREAASGQ